MKICIFEDEKFENLYPLVYLRPVCGLRCGKTLLYEKIARAFPDIEISFCIRPYLAKLWKKQVSPLSVNDIDILKKDDIFFINSRWLFGDTKFELPQSEEIGIYEDDIVYAMIKKETIASISEDNIYIWLTKIRKNIPSRDIKARLINYPWDLINYNGRAISEDFGIVGGKIEGEFSEEACIYGDKAKVHVGKGAKVYPMVVIDTTHGPVIIDEDVIIYPFSRIEGPTFIGSGSQIHGAKVREGSSIGPVCYVGGEVEEVIIHGYTNKFHDGFLGHSYVGEWVNLGALTTNSDLKNDYSSVSVYIKNELMDSGELKVGSFIGDHTKTSIGTFLNTGTVIGVMTNLVGSGGVLPKFVPSFTWYLNKKFTKGYGYRMLLKTAEAAMKRRGRELSEEEVEVLNYVYELTKDKREELVQRDKIGGIK